MVYKNPVDSGSALMSDHPSVQYTPRVSSIHPDVNRLVETLKDTDGPYSLAGIYQDGKIVIAEGSEIWGATRKFDQMTPGKKPMFAGIRDPSGIVIGLTKKSVMEELKLKHEITDRIEVEGGP